MNSRPSSREWRTTALAVLACTGFGLLALHAATAGFRVVSTEAGRRLAVARRPQALPPVSLRRAQDGRLVTLVADLAGDRRAAIVTFAYTRCAAICSAAGTELQQLQQRILARRLENRVRLLTISFDPADDRAALQAYARRMHADPSTWRLYVIDDGAAARARLLAAFGVVVVPAPLGEFVHNAAYHVIDRDGRLARIVDIGAADAALDAALAMGGG